ncbi:MAG: hypothetical protein EBQ92_03085 [Proteobacteria bacterium]|nr:hypothetical protein [Pseudomonadota bacterium]
MNGLQSKPHLRLIYGGKGVEGPATRLNLYERFPRPNKSRVALTILSKLLLLYVVFQVASQFK